MTDLKITIDQLKNYLGTELNFLTSKHQIEYGKSHMLNLRGISLDDNGAFNIEFLHDDDLLFSNRMNNIYPICYRLSDLDKEIEHNGKRFVPIEFGCNGLDNELKSIFRPIGNATPELVLSRARFDAVQKLFEWHFWPFGEQYFEQGLVIDKMKQT